MKALVRAKCHKCFGRGEIKVGKGYMVPCGLCSGEGAISILMPEVLPAPTNDSPFSYKESLMSTDQDYINMTARLWQAIGSAQYNSGDTCDQVIIEQKNNLIRIVYSFIENCMCRFTSPCTQCSKAKQLLLNLGLEQREVNKQTILEILDKWSRRPELAEEVKIIQDWVTDPVSMLLAACEISGTVINSNWIDACEVGTVIDWCETLVEKGILVNAGHKIYRRKKDEE